MRTQKAPKIGSVYDHPAYLGLKSQLNTAVNSATPANSNVAKSGLRLGALDRKVMNLENQLLTVKQHSSEANANLERQLMQKDVENRMLREQLYHLYAQFQAQNGHTNGDAMADLDHQISLPQHD